MNTQIELISEDFIPIDSAIRLVNKAGSVVVVIDKTGAYLQDNNGKQSALTMEQLRGVLATYFAEKPSLYNQAVTTIESELKAWDALLNSPLLNIRDNVLPVTDECCLCSGAYPIYTPTDCRKCNPVGAIA